ncbi:labile enterotoxin output A [Enterococcus durans IPLA 655]|uniref:LeoA/HP0731 family dynamin-like GTPase n=1 Tax=Enterococcus TaxID=1350 RepID=UPI0003284347|nr:MULTISPECIES: LeoA/HP0731 family dynamin-like GTPase [Enterococcus]EMS75028.1 labile enterotoxin output A [Enterococcus durans IPLA 655]KFO16438.1 labile enterotoxin output A [Enterococcus faecium UC7267]KGK77268.1 labile enterotoxin output A [Enterococcus faecium]KST46275.1 labile enterotoxin output A [Enterococcus faecium]MBK4843976.1 labile enterotoxin output A [Enterococcus faecium]
METIKQFKIQQIKIVEILQRLLSFINEGKKFGINTDFDLINKISKGIDEVKTQKLKVALVGGFSEGKTSIVAAWSGNYDSETMKIDSSESSDEVQIYHLDEFDLIDTPGLFGFKETSNQVKYKEITRKYVSEANLLLYVMNPNNPIKDSHKEELRWLFKDLNLLSRTVFVISRFDEEADIEDHEEYEERFETKKQNIITRLRDFDIIDENQNVPIVAVAANPFGEGFDYWLSNLDEYNQISHISDLQAATSEQIKKSGGANALVLATSQSIVKDVIQRQLPMVQQNVALAAEEINKFKSIISDVRKEQDSSERNISNARTELKEYITDLFTDLILQVKGTDIETINEFFERNIGDEGIVLETTIQNEFERQLGKIAYEISKAETNFNASINHYNNMVGDLAIQGMKISKEFLKNAKVSSKAILTTRDFLMPTFKFKPWGAIKLADKISKGFAVTGALLGIAVEAFDSYSKAKQEEEFNRVKNAIAENLIKQRKDYITFINNPQDFIGQFFPSYFDLLQRVKNMEEELVQHQNFLTEFEAWKYEGELIESDFEVIS